MSTRFALGTSRQALMMPIAEALSAKASVGEAIVNGMLRSNNHFSVAGTRSRGERFSSTSPIGLIRLGIKIGRTEEDAHLWFMVSGGLGVGMRGRWPAVLLDQHWGRHERWKFERRHALVHLGHFGWPGCFSGAQAILGQQACVIAWPVASILRSKNPESWENRRSNSSVWFKKHTAEAHFRRQISSVCTDKHWTRTKIIFGH